jgi:hypothetical protein
MFFPSYDDTNKTYEVEYSSGEKEVLTTQELYEFYLLTEHGLTYNFDYVKSKIDDGEEIKADDYDYDWNLGAQIYKGKLTIKKVNQTKQPSNNLHNGCGHSNKYINQAGGIKFWYCKDCKSDLGDV